MKRSGVSVTNLGQGDLDITVTHYVPSDGLLYSMEGSYNPANSSQVGSFDLPALAEHDLLTHRSG